MQHFSTTSHNSAALLFSLFSEALHLVLAMSLASSRVSRVRSVYTSLNTKTSKGVILTPLAGKCSEDARKKRKSAKTVTSRDWSKLYMKE